MIIMNIKYYSAAFILSLICVSNTFADTGTSAMSFLKVDKGARATALGGAYTALGDDAFSVFYNPAGTVFMDRKEMAFSHNMWLEDISMENFSYVQQFSPKLSFLVAMNMMLSGDIKGYDVDGNSTGSFNARETVVSSGISYMVAKSFYVSVMGKYFSQSADDLSTTAFGADFGAEYKHELFRLGFSALNYGTKLKLDRQAFDLPASLRVGISREIIKKFTLAVDWIKYNDSDAQIAVGGEYAIPFDDEGVQILFARGGYSNNHETDTGNGMTLGVGFKTSDLRLDYAFAPYGDLGNAHVFSLSLMFGDSRENLRETYDYHFRSREENRKQSDKKYKVQTPTKTIDNKKNEPKDSEIIELKPMKKHENTVNDFTW